MAYKISYKLIGWFSFIFILTAAVLNTIGLKRIENKIISEQVSLLYEEAQTISSEYLSNYYDQTSSLVNIRTQLSTVDAFLNVRIWAVDRNGTILTDTRNSDPSHYINLYEKVPELLNQNYIKNTTLKGILPDPSLVVCYMISSDQNTQGYIILIEPLENITFSARKNINVINVCLVILAVILLITFIYLFYVIVYPIRALEKGVHEYANGNFQYKINLKRNDEFKDLANSISYVGSELANLEDYQKKFIANVSHDFRSPLTSIMGYAQAIKDGTIPYEMQNKYLDIILFESERLTKLTSNLLSLNNIKHNGAILHITSFDMNNVIKTTAATFEGACMKKKILIQLLFEEPHAIVCADMDKIQQVIYNLLDNAIKFSPNNATIQIGTEEKNDKLFVSVKDHGVGIPAGSLHKIWERFYKTDSSRGKDKKGTGLGLSIVKEIINAHGENITVASTIDVGTEFIFTLPMSEKE
ncbi:sensor histidine kinase [[Clostridium] polysaccharolyticum]|uniref:histidine kinase n=1 Tax=[Clostridium] polysaccharolyticum TaxID=29364 RepID=A0A1I0E841_9FIRM|nr:HAMP domain-containing sensor histidine kinase [[Clostridium] polysaccharolyticum]SET41341.1 Signal transduction histidine kinase [[Clostridium] polysaccharolyticum]